MEVLYVEHIYQKRKKKKKKKNEKEWCACKVVVLLIYVAPNYSCVQFAILSPRRHKQPAGAKYSLLRAIILSRRPKGDHHQKSPLTSPSPLTISCSCLYKVHQTV